MEENKCGTCGHTHTNPDNTCTCGCQIGKVEAPAQAAPETPAA